MNQEQKGHGFFRKSKAYGLVCGITLAGFLMLAGTTAKADEVVTVDTTPTAELVTGNPSTNLTEAQAPAPEANTELATQTGNQSGTVTAPVTSPELDNAVEAAKEAGVAVSTDTAPTVHDNVEAAKADLTAQAGDVEAAKAKQEANTESIKDATEQNAAIDRQNEAEKKRVEEVNTAGRAAVDQRNKDGQKAVDERNRLEAEAVAERNKNGQAAVDARNAQKVADEDNRKAEIEKRNAEGQAKVDQENKEGQAAVDARNQAQREEVRQNQKAIEEALAYNEAEKARVEREYQAALAEWEKKKATTGANDPEYLKAKADYDKAKAQYDSDLEKYNTAKAAVDAHNAQAQAQYDEVSKQVNSSDVGKPSAGTQGRTYPVGEFPSDKWGNFVPVELGNGLVAMGKGNVANWGDIANANGGYNVLVKDSNKILDNAHIISRVEWGNVAPTGAGSLYRGDKHSEENGSSTYAKGNASQIYSVRPNEWVTIPGGVLLADGSRKDLEVKFEKFGDPTSFGKDWVVFWNEGGAINAIDGFEWNYNRPGDGLRRYYRVKDSNDAYLWTYVAVDTDAGQTTRLPHALILSIGGGLTALDQGTVKSGENLGYTYGKARDDRALAGTNSSPDGTAVFAAYRAGDLIIETQNSRGGNGLAVATGDFGYSINMKVPTFETLKVTPPTTPVAPTPKEVEIPKPEKGTPKTKEVPPAKEIKEEKFVPKTFTPEPYTPRPIVPEIFTPEKPRVETFTPEVYTPIKPVVLPHVKVPEKVQYKVAVHPVVVRQKPKNVKAVLNTDMEDVNDKLVAKGSEHIWVLTNQALKAGREEVTAYMMTDPFPSGIEVNWEKSLANSPGWIRSTDEKGSTILQATSQTLQVLNANRATQDVVIPEFKAYFTTLNDGATYENTFKTTIVTPKGKYETVSNTPRIYTPGRDPKKPRPPKPGTNVPPTPDDNLIQPKKDVIDGKGNSINGQSVLPGTALNYVAEQDFDQYKGMKASQAAISKGFVYVDDYLDKALDGKSLVVNSITAANGDDVRELLDMVHVLSKDSLDEKLQELVKASGISPIGEFYLWVAKDPQAFYNAYVSKGLDITYNLSFKIKGDFIGKVTNQTFQVDFGNGYYGNIVENDVPEMKVNKDVNIDGKAVDKGTIKLGDTFTYTLEGWVIPAGRGYDIKEYRFVDIMQSSHDEYKGFEVKAKVDITLADGTKIAKGTDLKEYTVWTYNAKTGTFELTFKDEFLAQVPRSSEFGSDVILEAKRIKSGTVENEFTLYVNGIPVKSDKVVTETPEPPKPPKQTTPTPPAPKEPAKATLPNTGEASTYGLSLAGLVVLFGSLFGLRKRKEN